MTELIHSISLIDWLSLAIGLITALWGIAQRSNRLPAWAREWLNKIGVDGVTEAIEHAATFAAMAPEKRREEAVKYLKQLVKNTTGLDLPTSIANLLIEFVYQQWQKKAKK